MTRQFDVIVLGSGPAGGSVAAACAKAGKSVALVESRELGGTCALRGCNPKKVYVHAGNIVDSVCRSRGHLIADDSHVSIDWAQLERFKSRFTDPIPDSSRSKFDSLGISCLQGSPQFTSRNTLSLDGQSLQAASIVIATGARPAELKLDGASHLTTSDQFLELTELPDEIIFVGGGYISCEFAMVASLANRKVTIIGRGERLLEGFDPDLVEQLTGGMRDRGIQVIVDAAVQRIERVSDTRLRLVYINDDEEISLDAGLIVHGAGRQPNVDSLQLEAADVDFDPHEGVVVDHYLRSPSNPSVFACGDCAYTDSADLTPAANEHGRAVAQSLITGRPHQPDAWPLPQVAFTQPSLARVGMLESQAREETADLIIRSDSMQCWSTYEKISQPLAGYKILISRQNDQILGAHLLGPASEELINLFALAMKFGHTAQELKSVLITFPTFSDSIRSML